MLVVLLFSVVVPVSFWSALAPDLSPFSFLVECESAKAVFFFKLVPYFVVVVIFIQNSAKHSSLFLFTTKELDYRNVYFYLSASYLTNLPLAKHKVSERQLLYSTNYDLATMSA